MKKTYISPNLICVKVQMRSHLLTDSGQLGMTVNASEEVSSNFVKENRSDYNVWNDDWSE